MSKRIPDPFIDEIISRADIVEIVGRRVALKRAGSSFKGLCPFHDEKTPSFTVAPTKGFYHCFGCGAHGTAIGFLMDYENLSFPEAIETLADMLGLAMPELGTEPAHREDDGLFALLREADQIYRAALRDSEAAVEYLRGRGVDGKTAAAFAIGYAPNAWDTLVKKLGTDEGRREKLVQAGLAIRNEQGRLYDRFRDRIMFPIRNAKGQVLGFGGRVMGAGEPKYLNSPETPVFHKGRALYGVHEARRQPGRPEELLVVEGYLDVMSIAQHGLGPAVATLGTATTADHVRLLTRMADRIVFCFDGDRAGRAAAWRALEVALPFSGAQVELEFLLLPEGEDPDSLLRTRGAEGFQTLRRGAVTLSQFFLEELRSRVDLESADGRARLIELARPMLDRLAPGVYRELLIGDLAATVGLTGEKLQSLLEKPPPTAPAAGAERRARKPTLIRKSISLVLHYPAVAARLGHVDGFDAIDDPGADILRELLELAAERPDIKTAHLVEHFRDGPMEAHLRRLAADEPLDDEQAAPAVLRDCLSRIVEAAERRRAAEALRGPGN